MIAIRPIRVLLALTVIVTVPSTLVRRAAAQGDMMGMHHHTGDTLAWQMPMMPNMKLMMLPGVAHYTPPLTPFLPGQGVDPSTFPEATPSVVTPLADGDTLHLKSEIVRRTIAGHTFVMYGFNGEYPGPLIRVPQHAEIVVEYENAIDLPTTIHWHGIRIENRYDGVPGTTQDPVPPGGHFTYHVRFPDAGIYWYHPHVREDIEQDLGLYGNMLVDSPESGYYAPANKEDVLILDDLQIEDGRLVPYGKEAGIETLMGRFGNVFLVNGEPDYRERVAPGSVVRYFLTNTANTRTMHVSFGGAAIKAVASDLSKFEHEEMVPGVVLAPAQRAVVDVHFDRAGAYAITNRVQALNHVTGKFYLEVDTLGVVTVGGTRATPNYGEAFGHLRENADVAADIAKYRPYFDRPPDHELVLTIRVDDFPAGIIQFMTIDTSYAPPIEWNDAMPMMNWVSNGKNTHWILRDPATGRENMEIGWHVKQGSVVKIRLYNDPNSWHPMSHPIHLHGQRFLVVARDGVPNPDLVWKDTVIVPVGSTVDILVDASNPGTWMLHCHIAEHLESGMMTTLTVDPDSSGS